MERINSVKLVFENKDICIFTKPSRIPTTNKNDKEISEDTFISKVFDLRPELSYVNGYRKNEGGLLYRLDNDTSGIVAVAKNSWSFLKYARKQKEGGLWKKYFAECSSNQTEFKKKVTNSFWESNVYYNLFDLNPPQSAKWYVIDRQIGFSRKSNKKMVVKERYKNYRGKLLNRKTYVRIVKKVKNKYLLDIRIKKGARHQIRVHLSSIGFPIVYDKVYNRVDTRVDIGELGLICYGITVL